MEIGLLEKIHTLSQHTTIETTVQNSTHNYKSIILNRLSLVEEICICYCSKESAKLLPVFLNSLENIFTYIVSISPITAFLNVYIKLKTTQNRT